MTIGDRIRKKREDVGISQTDLANAIDVSKQTLYKYENNIITNIPSDKIEKISKILDISPVYIMGWDESYYLGENLQNIFEILSNEFSIPTNELIRCFFSNDFSDLLPSKKIISLDNMRNALQKYFSSSTNRNNIMSPEEQVHIKKYRVLDAHGKKMVDFTLQEEWKRSTAEQKAVPVALKEDTTYYVNAAHPIDNSSEEDKQFDEDIMREENF